MRKQVWCALLVALVLCMSAGAAHAQSDGKVSVFVGYSFMRDEWGNSCVAACLGTSGTNLHGYALSGTYNVNRHFGLEANFSGHNGSPTVDSEPVVGSNNGFLETEKQDFYSYTFGPVLRQNIGGISVFAHFLVGGDSGHEAFISQCLQSSTSEESCGSPNPYTTSARGTGFALKLGGGADWNHGMWGVRILEVDYVNASTFVTEGCNECTQPQSFDVSGNNVELSTGLKINFGGMK